MLSFVVAGYGQEPPAALELFPVRTLWTIPLDGGASGRPVVDPQHLYLRVGDRAVQAIDARTGAERWTTDLEGALPSAVGDGRVFATDPTAIRAVDASTGALAWTLPIPAPLSSGLSWNTGWLVAGTAAGVVIAMRAVDGTEVWRRDIGTPLTARPTIAGEQVLVPLETGVTALTLRTGEPQWHTRLGGTAHEALAVGGRVYVGSNDNHFYCLDAPTGRVEWRFRTGADAIGLPAADDDRVYFVALDNVLRALDLGNGAQRWKRALALRPVAGPLRVGAAVVVTGLGPMLYAYATNDGAPAGEFTAPGDLVAAPVAAIDALLPTVFVVARDIAKGDTLQAITRAIEPAIGPVAPLPNPVILAPLPGEKPPAPTP